MYYQHKKTGNIYRHLAIAIDTTNAHKNQSMVVYCPPDNEHTIYVREEAEFNQKFSLLPGKPE